MFNLIRRWKAFRPRLVGFKWYLGDHWKWLLQPFNSGTDVMEVLLSAWKYCPVEAHERFNYKARCESPFENAGLTCADFRMIAMWRARFTNHARPLYVNVKLYRTATKMKGQIIDCDGKERDDWSYVYFLRITLGNDHLRDGYLGSHDTTAPFTWQTYATKITTHRELLAGILQTALCLDKSMMTFPEKKEMTA